MNPGESDQTCQDHFDRRVPCSRVRRMSLKLLSRSSPLSWPGPHSRYATMGLGPASSNEAESHANFSTVTGVFCGTHCLPSEQVELVLLLLSLDLLSSRTTRPAATVPRMKCSAAAMKFSALDACVRTDGEVDSAAMFEVAACEESLLCQSKCCFSVSAANHKRWKREKLSALRSLKCNKLCVSSGSQVLAERGAFNVMALL